MNTNATKTETKTETKENRSKNDPRLKGLPPLQRALFGIKELRKQNEALKAERDALLQQQRDQHIKAEHDPIAIVGMGCRFPGNVNTPRSYWDFLKNRKNGIVEIPTKRWDNTLYYDPDPDKPGGISTKYAGLLNEIDKFDAAFFRIMPKEAKSMDPQQRLLLEVTWEALENANIPPHTLVRSDTGVFIGIMGLDYGTNIMGSGEIEDIDAYFGTGNTLGLAAGRISYAFKLNGPSFSLDTACSSSLVAMHLACRSLRENECNTALVGGVNIILAPEVTMSFSKSHLMAPDGKSKAFDASADGYVRGEGCGVVCLKRISQAMEDGDRIHAVIRGSAVNHDGPSGGLTVPSGPAQEAVIRRALKMADLSPNDIDFIECHGTGTELGDPIEVSSLGRVFTTDPPRQNPLLLGSVKSNFGHLEAAAGMASLFKVVMSLENETIPGQLHFNTPNPKINWNSLPIKVADQNLPWNKGERIRSAGISGFSFGGTNAHVIVSEPPDNFPKAVTIQKSTQKNAISAQMEQINTSDQAPFVPIRPYHMLSISARSREALTALVHRYRDLLKEPTPTAAGLKDICHTAAVGRTHMNHRLALIAESNDHALSILESTLKVIGEKGNLNDEENGWKKEIQEESGPWPTLFRHKGKDRPSRRPQIVFLFTGQGAQYPDMGLELYNTQPVFRQAMDHCFDFLDESGLNRHIPKSLKTVMFPPKKENDNELGTVGKNDLNTDKDGKAAPSNPFTKMLLKPNIGTSDLDTTLYTQPAMFILEFALTELWKSWGIFPDAVMGHSLGEYGAACAAGVFSPEDGLRLIVERARLMHALPDQGKMVSVFAPLEIVETAVVSHRNQVSVAAINGPEIVLISGVSEGVDRVVASLEEQRIRTIQVNISTAFHSPLTEAILEEFRTTVEKVVFKAPLVPVISNITGTEAGDDVAVAEYWLRHMRQPVQFVKSMIHIRRNYDTLLEIGPAPNIVDLDLTLPDGFDPDNDPDTKTTMLRMASLSPKIPDTRHILQALAKLYVAGIDVNWDDFEAPFEHRKTALPNYPFQRERHWIDRSTDHISNNHGISSNKHLRNDDASDSPISTLSATTSTVQNNRSIDTNEMSTREDVKDNPETVHDQFQSRNNPAWNNTALTGNELEKVMTRQIATMQQLMKRHLELLKKNEQ